MVLGVIDEGGLEGEEGEGGDFDFEGGRGVARMVSRVEIARSTERADWISVARVA